MVWSEYLKVNKSSLGFLIWHIFSPMTITIIVAMLRISGANDIIAQSLLVYFFFWIVGISIWLNFS
jgi:hypothetical protein